MREGKAAVAPILRMPLIVGTAGPPRLGIGNPAAIMQVTRKGNPLATVSRGNLVALPSLEMRPAPQGRTDAELVTEMKARLALETWVSARGIWVDAQDGTIALIAVVNSEAEQAALEMMARGIDGVRGVENHLLVKSKSRDYGVV